MTTATRTAPIDSAPGFLHNLFTLGISMARWVDRTNKALGRGGAGSLFAWFLPGFAYYGLAGRLNDALAAQGSRTRVSPLACFFLAGFPFIGSRRRLGRAADALTR